MIDSEALIIFAKYPDPQNTKSRLSPPLNREDAAGLYECFLEDTLAFARRAHGVRRIIAYDPPPALAYFKTLAPDFELMLQAGPDLGERMHLAFVASFAQGYQRVILVGSDLPHLTADIIDQGFQYLRQSADLVLGPSADGGYYLVGLTRPQPQLFDLSMSTPNVLDQTLEIADRLGLRRVLLPENFDIDTASDLAKLKALLEADTSLQASHTRAWLAHLSPD